VVAAPVRAAIAALAGGVKVGATVAELTAKAVTTRQMASPPAVGHDPLTTTRWERPEEGVPPLSQWDPTASPQPRTREEVEEQMDDLADFLRAKMVRLEAEVPQPMDAYARAPRLIGDLNQLSTELALLADTIDDAPTSRGDERRGAGADAAAQSPLPVVEASPRLQELQMFEAALSTTNAERVGNTTWTVEVELSPDPEPEQQLQLQQSGTEGGATCWLPEVGWDEAASCAWVREWDDQTAAWRYTNLDTQQDSWVWPEGVDQFEPVDPNSAVVDDLEGNATQPVADRLTDEDEREQQEQQHEGEEEQQQEQTEEDRGLDPSDNGRGTAPAQMVLAADGAAQHEAKEAEEEEEENVASAAVAAAPSAVDHSELETAIRELEQRLATITAANEAASAVTDAAVGTDSPMAPAMNRLALMSEGLLHAISSADADALSTADSSASVGSALAAADFLSGNIEERPSERLLRQAGEESMAHLKGPGRRQMEDMITARVTEQVERSIAALAASSPAAPLDAAGTNSL
jgi:hypothetical protein